jgi:predicted PurR-regulated permease PerM
MSSWLPNGIRLPHFRSASASKKALLAIREHGVWLGAGILALALAIDAEALLDWLGDGAKVLFELAQSGFESFFRKAMGLELHRAQMATAYLNFFILLVLLVFLGKKWARAQQRAKRALQRKHQQILLQGTLRWLRFKAWWERQDRLNQCAAVVFLALAAIPLFILLSYSLGLAVAELL